MLSYLYTGEEAFEILDVDVAKAILRSDLSNYFGLRNPHHLDYYCSQVLLDARNRAAYKSSQKLENERIGFYFSIIKH
jgi:hypothetical protein